MPFTKIEKPVVGEAISKATFADVVIENLDSLQADLQQTRLNVSNSSFEIRKADGKPANWTVIQRPELIDLIGYVNSVHESIHGDTALRLRQPKSNEAPGTPGEIESDYLEVAGGQRLAVRWAERCPIAVPHELRVHFYDYKKDQIAAATQTIVIDPMQVIADFTVQPPVTVSVHGDARFATLVLGGPSGLNSGGPDVYVYYDNVSIYQPEQLVVEEPNESSHAATKGYVDLWLPAGVILPFARSNPPYLPEGWLLCEGQEVNRYTYDRLFGAVGYTFGGSGDTFLLPDLRGRTIIGLDNMNSVGGGQGASGRVTGSPATQPGDFGGAESHPLTKNQMPRHNHQWSGPNILWDLNVSNTNPNVADIWALESGVRYTKYTGGDGAGEQDENGLPHNNMQPYIALSYIIKY